MDNPNPNRGSILPWIVTLAALVVMIIMIMQRPHPPAQPEQPLDPADLAKANALIDKGGQWQAADKASFKEIYDRLPAKEKLEVSQSLARAINSKKVQWPPEGPDFAAGGKPVVVCSPPTCPPAGTGTQAPTPTPPPKETGAKGSPAR
jgi:hypothetical protein